MEHGTILCAIPFDEEQRLRLEQVAGDCTVVYTSTADATAEQVREADIILGNVAPALIGASPRLAFLQLNSAGADQYVVDGVLAPATKLASARGAYGQAVSEHAFAQLLCMLKKLDRYQDNQRAHRWHSEGAVGSLAGARVLILGAGDIGCAFARLVRSMGAHAIGTKRSVATCPADLDEVCTLADLDEALPTADVVVSFLPAGPGTDGLADERFFDLMKPGAYFLNAGRGSLCDQGALIAALKRGALAGAALDVTAPEPLPADDPLWDAPNLLITPHAAGGYHLPQTLRNVVEIAIDNTRRVLNGEEPRNAVAHA